MSGSCSSALGRPPTEARLPRASSQREPQHPAVARAHVHPGLAAWRRVTVLLSLGAFISAEAMLPHKQAKPAETTLDAQSNPGQISFSKILGLL